MKLRSKLLTILVLLATITLFAAQTDPAKVMMEAAKKKEVVDGDINAAIQEYKAIVAKFPKQRAVVADALIRMAECYEKLGDFVSNKIYEQILRDYADQKDAATLARTRLGGAAAKDAGIVTRQVWMPKMEVFGSVSPDGRYLSYFDNETGDLALHDLTSGTGRRLTTNKQAYEAFAVWSTFDPHSYQNEDIEFIAPHHWSPDGKWIAVQVERKDREVQIGLVSTADGSFRVLKSVDWRHSNNIVFSPDGRYIAFDLPTTGTEPADVFVLAIDGSREIPAVVHGANDAVVGWTPDVKNLLFISDRAGSFGLWALPFGDGKPQGSPQLIKSNIGWVNVMGLTRSGKLYFAVQEGDRDLAIASVDFNSGALLTPPVRPIESFIGINSNPDWSPDGRFISYVSNRQRLGQQMTLAIRSVETGQTRHLNPKLRYFRWPRWSPDSRSFLAQGTDLKGREAVYKIDAQTGDFEVVANGMLPEWSPGGKRIFYRRNDPAGPGQAIVERDLASGVEREILRRIPLPAYSVAPDGRHLAVVSVDETTKQTLLLAVPVMGGETRELVRLNASERISNGNGATNHNVTWTPDGGSVLFHKMPVSTPGNGAEGGLWSVPVTGGQPRKIDLGVAVSRGSRVHPDGKQIVFVAPEEITSTVWVMENFLPTANVKK
ncbi:MAG: PD40 domain-containing protein [Acidobacteria bacterium]|nr:PD40 domain-containing protein [Acidobacteriota bacterium]